MVGFVGELNCIWGEKCKCGVFGVGLVSHKRIYVIESFLVGEERSSSSMDLSMRTAQQ